MATGKAGTARGQGTPRRRRRMLAVLAAILAVALVAVCVLEKGPIMDAITGRHIIREKARNIPRERIDKGVVRYGTVGGRIRQSEFDIQIFRPTDGPEGPRARFIAMNLIAEHGGDVAPRVGETVRRPEDGIAITLLALGDDEGTQDVEILIERCQDRPSIRQKADMPQEPSHGGKTHELRMADTLNLGGGATVSLGYGIIKNPDGTYSLPVILGNEYGGAKRLKLSLGETKTPDGFARFDYTVTLLALTDVDGHQGATLLITPTPRQ